MSTFCLDDLYSLFPWPSITSKIVSGRDKFEWRLVLVISNSEFLFFTHHWSHGSPFLSVRLLILVNVGRVWCVFVFTFHFALTGIPFSTFLPSKNGEKEQTRFPFSIIIWRFCLFFFILCLCFIWKYTIFFRCRSLSKQSSIWYLLSFSLSASLSLYYLALIFFPFFQICALALFFCVHSSFGSTQKKRFLCDIFNKSTIR